MNIARQNAYDLGYKPPKAMSKRELIEPNPGDKRYVRRNEKGEFTSNVDLNRSLSQDDKHNSSITSKPGQGDRGDGHTGNRKPAAKK